MKLKANKYEPKDIMKIVREWTNKTPKEFREDVK